MSRFQSKYSWQNRDFHDDIVRGKVANARHYTKFGYRTGITAAGGYQTIWAYSSGNFTPMTTASTFTITYNNSNDGLGTNGALSLYFDYIDADGLYAITQITLGNSGTDVTSFTGLGINRVAVVNSGSGQTNVSAITVTETTGGTVQGYLPAGEGVTQQAIFHTDEASQAIAKFVYVKVNKLASGNPRVTVHGWVFNRTYSTKFLIYREIFDTRDGDVQANINEPIGFRLSPRDVLYFEANTDTNDTEVDARFSLIEYKN